MISRLPFPLIVALVLAGLAGCAAPGPKPAGAAAAGASATGSGETAPPAAAAAAEKNPFPGTHRKKGPDGETYYCWDYAPTGTRIPEEVCATEKTLKDRSSRERRAFEEMRERNVTAPCPPGMAC